jgi:hypothetical protein
VPFANRIVRIEDGRLTGEEPVNMPPPRLRSTRRA